MTKRSGSGGPFMQRDHTRHPPALAPAYKSTAARSPRFPLLSFDNSFSETTGPVFGDSVIGAKDHDLVRNFAASDQSAIGQQIIIHGFLQDQNRIGIDGALIEIWQANAGGRYRHKRDGYLAPLDPNFGGCGRVITDENGYYAFRTIKPGPYPWPNRANDWRPAHVHFSIFGTGWAQRLVTQMYFEGDPLIPLCPIIGTISDPAAIQQLTATLDMANTIPMDAQAYRFDMVLRGQRATLFETSHAGG